MSSPSQSKTETHLTSSALADHCDHFNPTSSVDRETMQRKILEVAGLSELFKVLSDETRTRIVYLLSQHELCVCDIADVMEMTQPAVSHHLRLLKIMRLVKNRRVGKNVYYSLDDHHVLGLIKLAQEHFAEER